MFIATKDDNWERVPDEDLWQDGELSSEDVKNVIYLQVVQQGEWILLRRKNNDWCNVWFTIHNGNSYKNLILHRGSDISIQLHRSS